MNFPKKFNNAQPQQPFMFKKGMSLQQYLLMNQQSGTIQFEQQEQDEILLYNENNVNNKGNNKFLYQKITTYAINEIDEDEYKDQSNIDLESCQNKIKFGQQNILREDSAVKKTPCFGRQSQSIDQKIHKGNTNQINQFRIKNQSISPTKKNPSFSLKKDMFRSLYGNSFGSPYVKASDQSTLSSTIHSRFFPKTNIKQGIKKQMEFKQKNKKHYNEVMKYQYGIQSKYNKVDTINMRIDGIKDKLYERKHFNKY